MQPIVNGLQAEYDAIDFLQYNARDGAEGETFWGDLGLRGHPALVLFDATGKEVWRVVGEVSEQNIRDQLDRIIDKG